MAEASSSTAGKRNELSMPEAPTAIGIGGEGPSTEEENPDEWEYEYSATETETYYLTVELSLPEFKGASTRNPHHSRAGYYKTWQAIDRASATARAQDATQPGLRNDVEDEEPEPEPAPVEDGMEDIDPSLRIDPRLQGPSTSTKRKADGARDRKRAERVQLGLEKDDDSDDEEDDGSREDIQVLDLHSNKPMFSYRGRIFEGSWAENVGTEMIMVEHEKDATLPVLRHLEGDVDLLAASASRILTKEKILQPKVQEEDTLAPIIKDWNINIPKGAYKMSERARQGEFLERLMALKLKKGEKDQVTVYARRNDIDDEAGTPRRRRRKKNQDAAGEGETQPKKRRRGRGGRPSNRARALGVIDRLDEEPLSVPTPRSWAELGASGSGERQSNSALDQDLDDINEEESEDEEDNGDDEDHEDHDGDDAYDLEDIEEEDDDEDMDDEAAPGVRPNTTTE